MSEIGLMDYLFVYKNHNGSIRKGIYKQCKTCNTTFFAPLSKIKYSGVTYCCRECSYKSKNKSVTKICEYCGKTFTIPICRQYTAKFCSKECQGKNISLICVSLKSANWQGGQVEIVCKTCGKSFFVDKHRKDIAKFCSTKCMGIFQSGDKANGWKGGISFAPYCEKFNEAKKEEIREKYGRECFICGKSEEENGNKLDAHHVDYQKDQGCSSKWSLVPLCRSCHAKTNFKRRYWEFAIKYKLYCQEIENETYEIQ